MNRELLEETIILRHELHRHPELSGQEVNTKKFLMEMISEDTDLEVCDRGSWFYAYYDSGRPGARNVAVRADMDALPMADISGLEYCSETAGISHRCGHDGHSAVLYGLARMISEKGAASNVFFIFQHGEETGLGAAECAELIDEKNIDEMYAFHNWSGFPESAVVLKEGTVMCASEGLRVIMKGKPSHASRPEDGASPAFALSRIVAKAGELEEPGKTMATVVGINCGGANFGMMPGEGEVDITLRALREEDMAALEKGLTELAEAAGSEAGLEVSIEKVDVFPETRNDKESVAKVAEAAGRLGLEICRMKEPIRSSEDFGWYQKKCSGAMIFIGNGEDYPQVHTEKYDFNDNIIEVAVQLLYEIIMEA